MSFKLKTFMNNGKLKSGKIRRKKRSREKLKPLGELRYILRILSPP